MTFSPMFPFSFIKNFAFLALAVALVSSCRTAQNGDGETSGGISSAAAAATVNSRIPFPTKEPESFQTEIVVSANGTERKTFFARSGARRRYDFDAGTANRLSMISSDREYLLLPDKKIYAENSGGETLAAAATENWTDFLTNEWLNRQTEAIFEKLETADGTTKYSVRPENAAQSEIVIFVDETRGFPVRQEFYSIGGGERVLNYAVELRNLKIPADENAFVVPKDYKKVSAGELRKVLQSGGN